MTTDPIGSARSALPPAGREAQGERGERRGTPAIARADERRVVGPEDAARAAGRLGGKAENLLALSRAGLPVPAWICATTAVFADVEERARPEIEAALAAVRSDDRAALEAASARILAAFRRAGLREEDRVALAECARAAFPADALLAVRSSALGEDSARDSFAGQLDTYLFVPREDVPARVVDCFASAYSARALLYRRLRGAAAARPVEAAAIVQLMVDARAAGVLFTANPTTGDRSEAVISAGLGLGEGVVGDQVETDVYHVDLATGAPRGETIATKTAAVAFDRTRGRGTRVVPVPAGEGARPALAPDEVAALAVLGRRVEELFGGAPQDIEWAIDRAGRLALLQARPITTLARGRERIFDSANVVESYPGLSLPLTFSFARQAYEATFLEASRVLGMPERTIAENRAAVHAHLIGLVDGRIYYDILNWYRLYLLVPGFERLVPAFEKALGLARRFIAPRRRSAVERLRALPAQARIVFAIAREGLRLEGTVRRFFAAFEEVRAEFCRRDLAALEASELLELHELLCRRLLGPYAVSLLNDLFTQQSFELLRKLIERWRIADDPARLRNDLLCGEAGMESVEPVRSALELAAAIRAEPRLLALFEGEGCGADVLAAIERDPALAPFRAALARHLERFGDRTLHELKLETPPASEDPEFLVAMLRNYLRGGRDLATMGARERELRAAAEAAVAGQLAQHPLRRWIFGRVLAFVRRTVRHRENLRLARTRAFGMVKRIFRALGRRLAEAGRLGAAEDVFWLTVEEVAGEVRGGGVTRDLWALVELRKKDYAELARREPPGRVVTYGLPYAGGVSSPASASARARQSPSGEAEELRGIGCVGGVARGRAKVILDPKQDLRVNGEILVAPMTDPGWVFLMVAAAGLVVERGSPLSHTAIIGRELGIPTVVAVKDATRRIRDGEMIEIDGRSGVVRRLASGPPAP